MITGQFSRHGELLFEIEVIAEGEIFAIEALLDTGFTTGWLAMDVQDVEQLGWSIIKRNHVMETARGEGYFDLYAGTVLLDGQEFAIPVHAGSGVPEVLLGLQWLETRRLVVDRPQGLLTLG